MKEQVTETTIDKLVPDDKNFNRGTEYGKQLLGKSFGQFGAGRSILIDKNNRIIAGNKATEEYGEQGGEKVIVVETDGKTLVAVKRTDIDLDSKRGRELALADNATQKADLDWDNDVINEVAREWDIDTEEWGVIAEEGMDKDLQEEYSRKVKAPEYEPSETPARLEELVDEGKAEELKKEIASSKVPKDVKEFLMKAADRHRVFNFAKIADYFARADKETQALMIRSALVIIDFDEAIHNGFVMLSAKIMDAVREQEERGDDEA